MDDRRFDELARTLASVGTSRRQTLKALAGSAVAGALALLGADRAAAQSVGPAACESNGARCGEKDQPQCGRCCSGCTSRQNNGQQRCSCCTERKTCRRDDQCCSGRCENNRCADQGAPGGTRRLVERGQGKSTNVSGETCAQDGGPCTDEIRGAIVSGSPITRGQFVGSLTSTNFQSTGGEGFTAQTSGRVNLTENNTANRLLLQLDGQTTGQTNGPFTFDGRYRIIGGTGRFANAQGSGDASATGTDIPEDPEARIEVRLTGSF